MQSLRFYLILSAALGVGMLLLLHTLKGHLQDRPLPPALHIPKGPLRRGPVMAVTQINQFTRPDRRGRPVEYVTLAVHYQNDHSRILTLRRGSRRYARLARWL